MPKTKKPKLVEMTLTVAEWNRILEGLHSHAYWELSEEFYRKDGYVRGKGASDPEAREELQEFDALYRKVLTALNGPQEKESGILDPDDNYPDSWLSNGSDD